MNNQSFSDLLCPAIKLTLPTNDRKHVCVIQIKVTFIIDHHPVSSNTPLPYPSSMYQQLVEPHPFWSAWLNRPWIVQKGRSAGAEQWLAALSIRPGWLRSVSWGGQPPQLWSASQLYSWGGQPPRLLSSLQSYSWSWQPSWLFSALLSYRWNRQPPHSLTVAQLRRTGLSQ